MSAVKRPPRTILVAEDEPDLLALLVRRLEKAGYVVLTAEDGALAARRAETLLPDCVLLDVMMPKLTGFEVASRLQANPTTQQIPVVLMSAGFHGDDDQADPPARRLRKPFGAQELTAILDEAFASASPPT